MTSSSTSAGLGLADLAPLAGSILVTRQQTRFNIIEDNASKEIDIKDLSIIIAAGSIDDAAAEGSRSKGKVKAKAEGLEILAGAHLRLKTSIHYSLVGRNGTGKSTILRALSQKLIPGIPLSTRIAILQQTAQGDDSISELQHASSDKSVLEHVVLGDPYRNEVLHELDGQSDSLLNQK